MIKYSKPSGPIFKYKEELFIENESKLDRLIKIAQLYSLQPKRVKCKNCNNPINKSDFKFLDVEWGFCSTCGHLNGMYEDTNSFCREMYTEDEGSNAFYKQYHENDKRQYFNRVNDIYLPKAEFLYEALKTNNERPENLRFVDFGSSAGYFVGALNKLGLTKINGYEVSKKLVDYGNHMLNGSFIDCHEMSETIQIAANVDANVFSLIFVLEHLQNPREVLKALKENESIRYIYFSVPVFSPSKYFEMVFPNVMPRQLAGSHTHIYTNSSIDYFCQEFGFVRNSEWWFGTDMMDFFRCILVTLGQSANHKKMDSRWSETFKHLIDDLQHIIDKKHLSSEVHLLLSKRKN